MASKDRQPMESSSAAIFLRELKMTKSRHPIEPLFSGEWA